MTISKQELVNNWTGSSTMPSTALLADGGWVVTWQNTGREAGDTGFSSGIFMQRYDADGVKVGDEVAVNTVTARDQTNAVTTALSGGGWVVAWQTYDATDMRHETAYQIYNAAGQTVGGEQTLAYDTDAFDPAIVARSDGGFSIAFTGNNDIQMAEFNAAGVQQGDALLVNNLGTGNQNQASIAALEGGGYVVAWQSDDIGLSMRVYDADGTSPVLNDVVIDGTDASHVDVAGLADGGFIVTWQTSSTFYSSDVRAQRFDADGNALGESFDVNSFVTGHQYQPSVTALANGGWVITYDWIYFYGTDHVIQQSVYNAKGERIIADMTVSDATPDNHTAPRSEPQVVALADGGWIVSWADDNPKGIVQQRFEADGEVYGTNDAPTGADSHVSVDEWGQHTFRAVDFGFSDNDGNRFAGIVISGLPKGLWTLDGTAVKVGDQIARADLGKLVWHLPKNLQGDDAARLRVKVVDDGGTEGSGHDTATRSSTVHFDIQAAIEGNSGVNRLRGTSGHDILDGKQGNDVLTGRGGSDTFIFANGYDRDTVTDFVARGKDHDIIDLSHLAAITDFTDLKANHISTHGHDVWIDAGKGDVLVLKGVDIDHLGKGDFQF